MLCLSHALYPFYFIFLSFQDIKKSFLKTFMPFLRKVKIPKIKLKILFKEVIVIVVVKRGAGKCIFKNQEAEFVHLHSFI